MKNKLIWFLGVLLLINVMSVPAWAEETKEISFTLEDRDRLVRLEAILKEFLEKYACGTISPNRVIRKVENKKEATPAITESDNKVSKTLIPTLPHNIVVNK